MHFPSGGGFTLTFPLAVGDEVYVALAERCIDGWWQSGGVQPQAEFRMHDLSDGFCFPKVWSQAKKITSPSITTAQLRSDDGVLYVELAAAHVCNIVAPGGVNITGNVHVAGTVIATGEGTFNGGHTVSAHVHGGVLPGGSDTDPPTG